MKEPWKYIPSLLLWVIVFYFLSERAIFRYEHLGAGVDVGLFENLFYHIIHTGEAVTSLGLDGNTHHYFADHINWFIYPISILYYLFPSIETLLIFQAFVLSVPILIIPFLGKEKTQYFFYPFLYALYLPIYWIQIFDFHPEVLWIPFFFLFYYFWKQQSKLWYLFFTLSLLVKEEISLVWIVFSLVYRKSYPKETIFIGISSSLYFLLSIGILSYFNSSISSLAPAHLERYRDPWFAITHLHLFPYLILFLNLPFLFLSFRSPLMFCLIPYLLYSVFSKFEVNKTPFTHHTFVTIPIIFLSFTQTLETLHSRQKRLFVIISVIVSITLFLLYGPISKSFSFRKEYMNPSGSTKDYQILRNLLPNDSIVSNIPQYLANRNEIQLYLPNKKYSANYYIHYQWEKETSNPVPPMGYTLESTIENRIHIYKLEKID